MRASLNARDVGRIFRYLEWNELKCIGISTGRHCDGYESDSPRSWDSPPHIAPMPCTTVAKTEPERRSFQFFRERTLSQLTASFAEELWDKTIFQVAETEPSIRHAMFALSGFHEHFLNPHKDNANMQLGFALTQYNLAIRELLCFDSDRGHTSIVLHLVSCLIFIAIEVSRTSERIANGLTCHISLFEASSTTLSGCTGMDVKLFEKTGGTGLSTTSRTDSSQESKPCSSDLTFK